MGDCVDREMAMSRADSDIETQAARQAHYIRWTQLVGIPDPCGSQPGYERILAIYAKYLMLGINYLNKTGVRSKTVKGYMESINTLFELRGMKPPADFSEPSNVVNILVSNLRKEEDVAKQRNPLDNTIFSKLLEKATKSKSRDSADAVLFNTVALGRITGHRLSEYAQTKQTKIERHRYPSGREVVKAFTANDFNFFDSSNRRITELTEAGLANIASVKVTWRIQKNRQNGQSLSIAADTANPAICPVRNAAALVIRARRLGQPPDLPVAFYTNKKGEKLYLTGTKIAELFRKAVKSCRPETTKEELSRYSAHSVRVWACVLLDEAGKSAEFIKKRLRWMGDSFRLYLRDTQIIRGQHCDALHSASQEVMTLIEMMTANGAVELPLAHENTTEGIESDVPTVVSEDTEMGDYQDEMD